ncbi:MAG TPA: class I SAM-dependent methyltransferase [Thermoanaerobaculia bacterium]|nr:class I SAM-dependent methyltransferase [Thermoanaerobaculia bacterium]
MTTDPVAPAFADHFSPLAARYAAVRPTYPAELFDWLAALPARRERAWDAGTGSGQAAVALAERFAEVIATDASDAQLAQAAPHPRVSYRRAVAEESELADGSIDLVTVAQAVHWFDLDRFWPEVRRVLAPGGAVAVWSYLGVTLGPELDRVIARFYRDVVGPWWPPERAAVEDGYRSLPFPFAEIEPPPFEIRLRWDLARFAGYLGTWSASRHWSDAHGGADPVAEIAADLAAAWGDPAVEREIVWPIGLRAGRPEG